MPTVYIFIQSSLSNSCSTLYDLLQHVKRPPSAETCRLIDSDTHSVVVAMGGTMPTPGYYHSLIRKIVPLPPGTGVHKPRPMAPAQKSSTGCVFMGV